MYPKEHEIVEALRRYIYDHGGTDYGVTTWSTYEPLADHFALSKEERDRTRDEEFGDGKVQSSMAHQSPMGEKHPQEARLLGPFTARLLATLGKGTEIDWTEVILRPTLN